MSGLPATFFQVKLDKGLVPFKAAWVAGSKTWLSSSLTPSLRLRVPSRRKSQFNSSVEAPSGKVISPASVIKPLIKLLTAF